MDTNVKKFKYSILTKIICILLCAITFLFGSYYAALSVVTIAYNVDNERYSNKADSNDWTNSYSFYSLMWRNCSARAFDTTRQNDVERLYKIYLENKTKYIDEVNKLVLQARKRAEENAEFEDYEDYEDYEDIDNETVVHSTVVNYYDYTDTYYLTIDGISICEFDISGQTTKEEIENELDNEKVKADIFASLEMDYGQVSYRCSDDSIYYVKYEEAESTNLKEFNEKEFYSQDYYFISKHGKLEYKGILPEMAENIFSTLNANSEYFKDIDFYFSFKIEDLSDENYSQLIINSNDKDFSQLYMANSYFIENNDALSKNITLSIIFITLSFIFGFVYFAITGRTQEGENAKLTIYDYLPFELSLAIAGGLGYGACWAIYSTIDNIDYINILVVPILVTFAMFCWTLLFFVSASFARYTHSGKKFYKHLISFWCLFAIWKALEFIFIVIKKCFRGFVNTCKKIKASSKRNMDAFLYKPHHYKRNILLVTLAWLLLNALSFGLIILSFVNEFVFLALLTAVGIAVVDVLTLRKYAEYIKNLDTIIDAASRHEEIMLDIDKLDISLKTLAESMRYTNAELQNAITKAVKDERLRTELITNVSHDLKTPLTSIINYVDLLSKCDIKDEKAQEYIKVLDDKGAKLKRLIDDLIEASKVTSGNVTVNLTPMNLSELCLQATVDAQTDFEKAGLELVVKQGEKPSIVIADGTKANRVIENLLSNARKYSARASRVYVSVYNEANYGVFEIKNVSAQPLDITPEELTERFVRGDKSRNQDGNGLGLSIAKELCQLQNGKLELNIDGDLFKARVLFPNK